MKLISLFVGTCLLLANAAQASSLEEAFSAAQELLKDRAQERAASAPGKVVELTPLQKHVAFFDRNGDGTITVAETELGLRALGQGRLKAGAAALLIHAFLGPRTSGGVSISVKDIHKGKHGSDTGIYDEKGYFVPAAFESMFAAFDVNRSGSLSGAEIDAMVAANSKTRPGHKAVAGAEFGLLLSIAADATEDLGGKKVPALSKERLMRLYDGSLFYTLAKKAP